METQDTQLQGTASTRLPRTGPVSRSCRLLCAAVIAWFAFDWAEAGLTWFSKSTTPANPGVWIVTGLAIYYGLYQLPQTGFGDRQGRRVVAIFGALLVTAASSALVAEGELWAAPLTWLLYSLDVGFLIMITISYLVSVVLGTPGCEVGGLAELIRRLRSVSDAEEPKAMWCIAGLHRVDKWEAAQAWRASSRDA